MTEKLETPTEKAMLNGKPLLAEYIVECCACEQLFTVRPSPMMLAGDNKGGADCPSCKAVLFVEVSDNEGKMDCKLWEEFIKGETDESE